jgi:hypothetical protein
MENTEKQTKAEYKLKLRGRFLARSGKEFAWSLNGKGITWRNEESVLPYKNIFGGEIIRLSQ